MFRELPPFSRWGLPPPEQIRFGVNSVRGEFGRYLHEGRGRKGPGKHYIEISRHNVKSFHALAITMAHEIIHLHQQIAKTYTRSQHNAEFMRLAKRVCRVLGFDSKGFT